MVHGASNSTTAYRDIRIGLRHLRVRLGAIETELEKGHPDWLLGTDARLTCFAHLANTVESTELALKFLDECLSSPEWWAANYNPMPPASDAKIYFIEFSQFAKGALLQLAFGSIEASLRVFLRAIDPAACGGGMGTFKSVYDCLLQTKLHLADAADRIALLDLLRQMRNSIHNHGVVFNRTKGDVSVTYRGQRYDFAHETPTDIAQWLHLITWLGDSAELLAEVVHTPEITGIASRLLDPAAGVAGPLP